MKHRMKIVFAVALAATAAPALADSGKPGDTVSPAEAKIIVQAAQDFMKDCRDCVAPGFDFKARAVTVSAEDLKQRDKWIKDVVDKYGGSAHDSYMLALTRCEWRAPKLEVDVAVVKFWEVNQLGPPLPNVFDSLGDACGNPPDATIKAFVQRVKRVHIQVAPHWPKECRSSCGYGYTFSPSTGTLEVGVHNHPINLDVEALAWLKKQ
jgi:hypothetical protein